MILNLPQQHLDVIMAGLLEMRAKDSFNTIKEIANQIQAERVAEHLKKTNELRLVPKKEEEPSDVSA